MKELRFLLVFVLLTQLQIECETKSEPFIFKPADAEKKVKDEGTRHETTTSLVKPLKESGEPSAIGVPAEDDDSDDDQPGAPDEPSAMMDWDEIRNKLYASLRLVSRCSRRFYPGLCSEPVHSVWAYSFSHQTCIERLGCRKLYRRANRFGSYEECMFNCRSLIDVYTHILAYQESQSGHSDQDSSDEYYDDALRKAGRDSGRKSIATLENLISTVEEYTDAAESYTIPESSEGKPPEEMQRDMPVDIDRVPADYMDVQYDFNTNRYRRPRKN